MGQQSPLTWIWFGPRRVYRCCVSSNGVSAHQSERNVFRTPGKRRQTASRRCVCGCGESLVVIRADKGKFVEGGMYLMFQPAERSSTFWIRALVGTGEDLVLRLRGRGRAHWGRMGGGGEWRRGIGWMGRGSRWYTRASAGVAFRLN